MKKRKSPKLRKGAWFYQVRGSYLPATTEGWLTYIPFIAYLIWPVFYVSNRNLDLSASVFVVVPQWIAATVVMTWIAARKS
jgi:hypothetical protein